MDVLISLKRRLDGTVGRLGLRPAARWAYRKLLKLRYGTHGLATALHNGRTWKLHYEVALRGEYAEFETVEWLRKVVKPGNNVIDIGANVGQMSLEAAHLVGSGGKVVAIEPAPGNLKLLRAHIDANGFADRVEILAAACGSSSGGEVTLHVYGNTSDSVGSGHSVCERALGNEATVTVRVPMVSIDEICAERQLIPSVIKIDVEGAEIDVIRGAVSTLKTHHPSVRFGFHPFAFADASGATQELKALLEECGYMSPEPGASGSYDLCEYEALPLRAIAAREEVLG